jgi:hypothetical protein
MSRSERAKRRREPSPPPAVVASEQEESEEEEDHATVSVCPSLFITTIYIQLLS